MRHQLPDHGSASLLTPDTERADAARSSIADLVRASQAGNRDAFGALYERFAAYVHAILLARLPLQDAPDLVQDIFLSAFQRVRSLREPAAFASWIATIARNRATDFLRRPIMAVSDESEEPPAETIAPDVRLDAARALQAIRELPDAYRETLVLRLVEGLTGPEIAALTGLTPDSVRVNLHRGFKLLRERLGIAR